MKKIGGFRRKTRHLFRSKYFQQFQMGETVKLSANPAVQKGMYFPAYYGKTAIVTGKKGRCYEVMIKDGGKEKTLIVHPIHLVRL